MGPLGGVQLKGCACRSLRVLSVDTVMAVNFLYLEVTRMVAMSLRRGFKGHGGSSAAPSI